ncbi:hypothetical protein [Treponema sp.]|uniref:hypothetical protein n=1 Tax=Treponema sp. TaxID=166 RepID=UPI003F09793F
MGFSREDLAEKFLRTYLKPFTAKEMKKILNTLGVAASVDETEDFLYSSPNVLELADGRFITHAGAFTGEIFSIVPTAAEAEQGVFVPGDRCMPFVESDRISSTLRFYVKGKKVPSKIGTFDSDDAIDMFMLYGEEYAPQYIAADPANSGMDMISSDFELSNTVRLTGLDLNYLSEKHGYRKGDRILCCVTDWNAGKLNMMVLHSDETRFDKGEVGERRIEWFAELEKKFLESFERCGPMTSIEEQLMTVFFENRKTLCVPYCGSMEEFLFRHTKKISFQHYGVETRIWRKGEDVPAFGAWNTGLAVLNNELKRKISFANYTLASIPEFVYDQILLNSLYQHKTDFLKFTLDFICRDDFVLEDFEVQALALSLKERYAILQKDYNWFADQTLGNVRRKALELYGAVSSLVRKIDFLGELILNFPSQEVVILAQLHGHVLRMIESISSDPAVEENADALLLSLDGMEWNFEDIKGVLEASLEKQKLSQFKVIKASAKGSALKIQKDREV